MEHEAFVERVLQRLPARAPADFTFTHWNHAGRPTDEGMGVLPIAGLDADTVIGAVMDVDHYVGNLDHVAECRAVPDERYSSPGAVRFYQKLSIPVLGNVHHELVLHDLGEVRGVRVAAWDVLRDATDVLSQKIGFRSDYNTGAWLVGDGFLAYALASAPKRSDVGFLKWKALTTGADVAASRVLKANIEGLAAWVRRR